MHRRPGSPPKRRRGWRKNRSPHSAPAAGGHVCAACVHGIGCAVSRLQRCDAGKTVERTHTAECLKAGTGRHIHGLDEAACREGKHIGVRPNVGSQQGGVVGIAAGNGIVFPGAFEGDLQPGPVERNGSPDITGIGLDGRSGPGLFWSRTRPSGASYTILPRRWSRWKGRCAASRPHSAERGRDRSSRRAATVMVRSCSR